MSVICWLAQFRPDVPCAGDMVRCHLIPKRLIRERERTLAYREGRPFDPDAVAAIIVDPRSWVWGCGGLKGVSGHHGMLDTSRTLRIPLDRLPAATLELARELGMEPWLEREYGGAHWVENAAERAG